MLVVFMRIRLLTMISGHRHKELIPSALDFSSVTDTASSGLVRESAQYIERFMEICSTVVHPPNTAKKHLLLAIEAMKLKNQAGLDLSSPDKISLCGKNPLFEACRVGNKSIVKLFLANGAKLNVLDRNGLSPLYCTIMSLHFSQSMVDSLLEAGADVELHKDGKNPLMASLYNMRIKTAISLIRKGSNVNDTSLPSFCFVESVFSLNSNFVMVSAGVQFQLEDFDHLIVLSEEIVKAGLLTRTFYLTGCKSFQQGFTTEELLAIWRFQSLCLAAGFKVDIHSLHCAIERIHQAIANASCLRHQQTLYQQLDHFLIMDHITSNPLSLTRLARMSIRSQLATLRYHPTQHIHTKIEVLPVPRMIKDFLMLKGL